MRRAGLMSMRARLVPVWTLALLPGVLVLLAVFVVPMLDLLRMSFMEHDPMHPFGVQPSLENYQRIATDAFFLETIWRSLQVGFWTTLVTLAIAYPVADFLARAHGWERTLVSAACLLPLFVTVIVGVLGWYILMLPFGVFQQLLEGIGLLEGPLRWLRSFPALIAVLSYEHLPFAILILAAAIQNVPQDKTNAARVLGAKPWQVFLKVQLPLTGPGVVSSAILVFSLSISSYLVPILISGQSLRVLPMEIFSYTSELRNWPFASALAVALLVIVVIVTYLFMEVMNRVTKRGEWEMV